MRTRSRAIGSVVALVIFLTTSCMDGTGEEVAIMTAPHRPGLTSTPVPTVVDTGLAYGVPCKPPCWQGLTPGISTHKEAAQVVEQLLASGQADYIVEGIEVFGVYPLPATERGTVVLYFENDVIKEIGSAIEFYYRVGTLVEQFGGPEGIYLGSSATVCSSCEEWEPPEPPTTPVMSVPARLLYPNQGLWFLMLVPLSGLGCICPEMKVTSFRYYAPTSMQEALAEFDEVTEEDLVEWHGFGGGY